MLYKRSSSALRDGGSRPSCGPRQSLRQARSAQLGLRYEGAGNSEADDVGEMVSGHIRSEPRIGVLAGPAASRIAAPEISDVEDRCLKRAISPSERGKSPPEAKRDDVGPAVAVHIAEKAWV